MKFLNRTLSLILILAALHLPVRGQAMTDAVALVDLIRQAPPRVEGTNGQPLPAVVRLERQWSGDRCTAVLANTGKEPVRVGNIILFDIARHGLDSANPIYGEGFQKLSQTGGTLAKPVAIGSYLDAKHYRIPEPDGWPTVYGMMTLNLGAGRQVVLGFSSCKRFIGRFSFTKNSLRISLDPEGLELSPGESWPLEEFVARVGADRNALLNQLADDIIRNHPPLPQPLLGDRTGWCTWYGVSGAGNEAVITNAAAQLARSVPALRFIQIDEGYCSLGDWLQPLSQFGDMGATLAGIRAHGKLPGIWVAPFIAEPRSKVLAEHPEWFIQDDHGQPFNSGTVGFGGWEHGPWRVLDGTNPDAQKHLEEVFRTLREKWGVTYFKLDANYWGAIHGGKHFDSKATRIEAYRRGMEAILRGAGPGAIILGCNAPIWPSFGLVSAQRTGNDVQRSRRNFYNTARENLSRAWQNGKLWINDPDCVLLTSSRPTTNDLPQDLYRLHATVIHAVGGLVLSGDRVDRLGAAQIATLNKLMPPTGVSAQFEDSTFEVGRSVVGDKQYLYAFNWSDQPAERVVRFSGKAQLEDFWTGEDLGIHQGSYALKALPGNSARLIVAQADP